MKYYHISIHHPKAGKAEALIASMHRFAAALNGAPGFIEGHTMLDERTGALMGMVVWESKEAMQASVHLAREAVANDPFDEWEDDVQGFLFTDV